MDIPTPESKLGTMISLTSHPQHIMQLLFISSLLNVFHGLLNLIIMKMSLIKNHYYPFCTRKKLKHRKDR